MNLHLEAWVKLSRKAGQLPGMDVEQQLGAAQLAEVGGDALP